jgi:chromosome segregation ATPase
LIQAVMYFALGLLTASLIVLVVTPAIWRRAMRLTKARIESSVPLSLSEIQAEKDQLRAGFAVASRRLEIEIDKLRDTVAEQVVEINRGRDEMLALHTSLEARSASFREMEARVSSMTAAVKAADERIAAAKVELSARDERINQQAADLARLKAEAASAMLLTEEQKLELVARETEIVNLRDEIADAKKSEHGLVSARDALTAELAEESARLADERRRVAGLEASLAVLNTERTERLAELDRNVAELRAMEAALSAERVERNALAERVHQLEAERSEEVKALNAELFSDVSRRETMAARVAEAEAGLAKARDEIARLDARIEQQETDAGDNLRKALAAAEAEKESLATRLASIEDEVTELRAENADLRRLSGAELEADRLENERLRERLGEIALGVVRLAESAGQAPLFVADGNGSGQAHAGSTVSETGNGDEAVEAPSLAERIRALQHAGARH